MIFAPLVRLGRFAGVLLAPLLSTAGFVYSADWPQWGGDNQRNMASAEQGLPAQFDPGKKERSRLGMDLSVAKNVRWCVRLGTETYSSATIADGRVFIGTNDEALDDRRFKATEGGLIMCFDEASGELQWQLPVPRIDISRMLVSEDFDDMNLGICSTPTVDGERVYVVSNRGEVLCLDVHGQRDGNDGPFQDEAKYSLRGAGTLADLRPNDGDILWRFDMVRDLPVFPHDATNCSVLVHGDFIYVGTGNGVHWGRVVLPAAPSLIVLNKLTGELVAKDDGHISAGTFHGQWSSPSVANVAGRDLIIYGGGNGFCYAFEAITGSPQTPITLQEVWRSDANPAGYRQRGGEPIDYWKLVDNGTNDSQLVSPSEIIGTPVVYENRVYVAVGQDPLHGQGRGALSCIDPNGSGDITESGRIWQYTNIGRSMSTVSIADGLLYVAETFGKVHCLDAKTGEVQWIHDTREEIWASTYVADDKVYVGTRRGLVVLAAGKQKQVLAEIKLGSPMYSVPSAANDVLYIASQRNLWAVQDKGEMP